MPQLTVASAAPPTGTGDSGDGSSCRFLALLALYPPVLPLFSLPRSLSLTFGHADGDAQISSVPYRLGDALITMILVGIYS